MNPKNKKDRFSYMDKDELAKIIKKLTVEIDGNRGIPIPRYKIFWNEKTMRQFVRFLYRNLKEEYIAKVEVAYSFDNIENQVK